MPATIVQQKSAAQNSPTATINVSLNAPAIAGNQLIIVYAGDSYVDTTMIPSGFIEAPGARQEAYLGHYVWYKTATGGEQTVAVHPQVSSTSGWAMFEVSGLSGIGSMVASAGQQTTSAGTNYATPAIAPSSGERFVIATIGGSLDTAAMTTIGGWTNGYSEVADVHTTIASGTRDAVGVATRTLTFSGSQSTSTAATWDNAALVQSRTSIILAFNVGLPDTTAPSVPANVRVTRRKATSLTIQWDGSTDNVSVASYQIFINGSQTPVATTTDTSYTLTSLVGQTAYSLTVRSQDTAGNLSALSTPLSVTTLEGSGRYYWTGSAKKLLGPRIIGPPSSLAVLARVPWEGGPAYYSQFPQATASGMTNPSFFPLLVDFESVTSQGDVDTDKAYGVNGYYRLTADTSLSLVRNNGMIAFPGPEIADTMGNETVGYNIDDEVDMWAGPGWDVWNGNYPGQGPANTTPCGYDVMYQLTKDLPNDGRMRHMNYGKGVVFWENVQEASVFTNGGSNGARSFSLDAVSADLYFYSDGNTINEAPLWLGIPTGEVRRAANYGRHVVKRVMDLQQAAGIYQPVYGFVETAAQGANVPQEQLTDDKIEGAVWACICYEARGIIYFVHDFVYTGSNHGLRDNVGGHTPRVAAVNSRITSLAPILNTQSYIWEFNTSVKTMFKVHNGFAYIFAMSHRQATHDTTPRTFVLPQAITGKTVTVDGESRTIPVIGGSFVDSFAAEYSFHLYKVAL